MLLDVLPACAGRALEGHFSCELLGQDSTVFEEVAPHETPGYLSPK